MNGLPSLAAALGYLLVIALVAGALYLIGLGLYELTEAIL